MNGANSSAATTTGNAATTDVLAYVHVVAKRWKMIATASATVFVLSLIISLLLTKIYAATTLIYPQQDQTLLGAFMGQAAGGMGGIASDLLGSGNSGDFYAGILKSDGIKDTIIDRFDLITYYKEKYRVDTYKILDKKVHIEVGKKDGIISITAMDKDPKLAAAIANAYVDELQKLAVKVSSTGASTSRAFYEKRLAKAKAELSQAEDDLKAFQSKNKAVDLPEQAKGTIKGVAELMAQLAVQESQLAMLRQSLTDSTVEVSTAKAAIANLKAQIARLEGNGGGGSLPAVGSVPSLGEEYFRLLRQFKIKEAVVELLTKQFEMNSLAEAKDVSPIQVIQTARVPDKKTKPKRAFIVIGATAFAFGVSVFVAFLLEYLFTMPEDTRKRWRQILQYLPQTLQSRFTRYI